MSPGRRQRRQVGHPSGTAPRKAVEEARDPRTTGALRATQGAGWGACLPPAVCGACLELVQGAEAEVRLLRQGRLALLAAARGSGRCSTESAFTDQPRAREQRTPGRAQHPANLRRVSENDLSDSPYPLTMLAPWILGRAAVPSSVSNLLLPRLFGNAREPDRRAEDALGDTGRLAPETEGKPGLTHSRGASPSAQPGPRMWGAGTGTAPERPEPRPGSRVLRGWVPTASRAWCSGHLRVRSLARSLAHVQQLRRPQPGRGSRARAACLLLLLPRASPASPGFLPEPASKLACWDGSVKSLPPLSQVSATFLV